MNHHHLYSLFLFLKLGFVQFHTAIAVQSQELTTALASSTEFVEEIIFEIALIANVV